MWNFPWIFHGIPCEILHKISMWNTSCNFHANRSSCNLSQVTSATGEPYTSVPNLVLIYQPWEWDITIFYLYPFLGELSYRSDPSTDFCFCCLKRREVRGIIIWGPLWSVRAYFVTKYILKADYPTSCSEFVVCGWLNAVWNRSGSEGFPSMDCVSGTLCLLHYMTETSHLYSLRDFWRHFALYRAAVHSDCCFFALCTNILTYLLTYLSNLNYQQNTVAQRLK